MQDDENTQQDDAAQQSAAPLPSANDVLAQQMGTDYTNVENLDKQELQKDLSGQVEDEEIETTIPSEGAVDDHDTVDETAS